MSRHLFLYNTNLPDIYKTIWKSKLCIQTNWRCLFKKSAIANFKYFFLITCNLFTLLWFFCLAQSLCGNPTMNNRQTVGEETELWPRWAETLQTLREKTQIKSWRHNLLDFRHWNKSQWAPIRRRCIFCYQLFPDRFLLLVDGILLKWIICSIFFQASLFLCF